MLTVALHLDSKPVAKGHFSSLDEQLAANYRRAFDGNAAEGLDIWPKPAAMEKPKHGRPRFATKKFAQ